MSLLLSTAYNLYWLGRYMRRTQELVDTLTLSPEARAPKLRYLGWPETLAGDTEAVRQYLAQTALPQHFEQLNDNVQVVRGVIDGDAAELFNQLKRLQQAANIRAACFQVYACSAVMLDQKTPYVTLFWQLGDYVEMLDNRIRSGKAESRHYRYLADVVTRLPDGTAWDPIKQPLQAMVYTTNPSQFYRWNNTLAQLFEDGV
ncbi:hypothetical protein LVJ83_00590 [Uruburuella testudinis]|uniref:DUF403 domain-containing protein n=1 Tax=Uruburuella testudinis TaxID=1282863 RepID=A0ABY4DSK0_9NEIS|nr:alpha-E domain-containing protein [Uruburuella testudinis]UOO82010.1 hypothetical protein LVJ83_00590 [Uruburuella testudinis]